MNFIFGQSTVNLIAQFEGLKLQPYLDSVKIPTIGYGTTVYPNGTKVNIHDVEITKQQALDYLLDHLNKNVLPYMNNHITVEQNQNQVDALASLIYNIGAGAFIKSSVLTAINNQSSIDNIKAHWLVWNKGGGQVLQGLVNRRLKEFNTYIS